MLVGACLILSFGCGSSATVGNASSSKSDRKRDDLRNDIAPERVFPFTDEVASAIMFHPSRPILAAGTQSGRVIMWDLDTGAELREYKPSTDAVVCLRFRGDGTSLVAVDRNRTLTEMFFNERPVQSEKLPGQSSLSSVDFNSTMRYAAIVPSLAANNLSIWGLQEHKFVSTFEHSWEGVTVAFFVQDDVILTAGLDGVITLLDWKTRSVIHQRKIDNTHYWKGAISPRRDVLALYDMTTHQISLHGTDTLHPSAQAPLSAEDVNDMAFSPDGEYLVITMGMSSDAPGRVVILNAKTLKICGSFVAHSAKVYRVAFSPDGKWFATGSNRSVIKLWNFNSCLVLK
jgi:WD40 repeat protein